MEPNPEHGRTMRRKLIIEEVAVTQCAEGLLGKITKPIDKTLSGWKSMLQGFQIYFA